MHWKCQSLHKIEVGHYTQKNKKEKKKKKQEEEEEEEEEAMFGGCDSLPRHYAQRQCSTLSANQATLRRSAQGFTIITDTDLFPETGVHTPDP